MDANKLRERFLDFFRQYGHATIGYAPLIPENDPSVLFTTAGMHPLVPFLLGEAHPAGRRLANYQKCLRTNDIAEVGDMTHLTFFEMLGNWSLGDYWKEEAIHLNYILLTEIFGHDPDRLHITCFAGDKDAPRDSEAAAIWLSLGIPPGRITFQPKTENWWGPAGMTGPCGPDSEVFFDMQPTGPSDETPVTQPQRFVEICNNVFMAYEKLSDGRFVPLAQRNVDVGIGLERNLMLLQGSDSVFETDLFLPLMTAISRLARQPQPLAMRVIADHIRAAVFVMAEGVRPGNTDQPYIARRLVRRAIRYGRMIGIEGSFLAPLAGIVVTCMGTAFPEIVPPSGAIYAALDDEEGRFQHTLVRGEREFARAAAQSHAQQELVLPGQTAFHLYDTYGFPLELTQELAREQGLAVDVASFQSAFAAHQAQSRQGAAGRFKGGLAERNLQTTRLHTATHLLQAALRRVLGPHVTQRGSSITSERLRFDFNHSERLSSQQLTAVEELVNTQIGRDLPVSWGEMRLDAARQGGALGLFEERYGETVKVYAIGDFSLEICGGPHVSHTGELGHFHILKEEGVAAGMRRIKAILAG
ncbi:MAG: alanine--tRNA ligase [Chloroflexi bacterium]|nr:alanine--tRNA ligase [Chloroflexota bacterium]